MRPLILWPSIVLQMLQIRAGVRQSTPIPFSAQRVLIPIRIALTGPAQGLVLAMADATSFSEFRIGKGRFPPMFP
jgi:hypothetical protein